MNYDNQAKKHIPMFTSEDLRQIAEHGLTPEAVERQIEHFRRGFPYLKVVRAASPGDGVIVADPARADEVGGKRS